MDLNLRVSLTVVLGALLILSIPVAGSQEKEDFTFRKTRWGMSKSEVIEKEGEPDREGQVSSGGWETIIYYWDITVGGLKATLFYTFTEDKLVRGGYLFRETHTSENAYIDDYEKVKGILTNKYGKPESDGKVWHRDLYKDEPGQYGFAVSIGDLMYQATWETEETIIWQALSGDSYKISHGLYYDSKELQTLVEEKKSEQEAREF